MTIAIMRRAAMPLRRFSLRVVAQLLLGAGAGLWLAGVPAADEPSAPIRVVETAPLADRTLDVYQGELLDTAFEFATMIPVRPHIKDRSRTQAAVVEACLELDQPLRALRYRQAASGVTSEVRGFARIRRGARP